MSSIETKKLIKKFKIKFNPENLIFKYEVIWKEFIMLIILERI